MAGGHRPIEWLYLLAWISVVRVVLAMVIDPFPTFFAWANRFASSIGYSSACC